MTEKQLTEGQRLAGEIRELQEFQNALHAPYLNFIRACDYEGSREVHKTINIDRNEELYHLIDDCIENKIKKLQQEFESI